METKQQWLILAKAWWETIWEEEKKNLFKKTFGYSLPTPISEYEIQVMYNFEVLGFKQHSDDYPSITDYIGSLNDILKIQNEELLDALRFADQLIPDGLEQSQGHLIMYHTKFKDLIKKYL